MRFLSVGPRICLQLPSDSTSRWTPLLFSYTFPTTWACSELSPARARPWHANETCAARRTFLRTPERLINLSGVLSYFLCLLTRYWQFSILYNIFQVHPHPYLLHTDLQVLPQMAYFPLYLLVRMLISQLP